MSASLVELSQVIANCEFVPLAPVAPVAPVGNPKVKLKLAALELPAFATAAVALPPTETVFAVTVLTAIVAASPEFPDREKCTDNSSSALNVLFDATCVTASLLYPEASVDAPVILNRA